jgi:hypothetical protein
MPFLVRIPRAHFRLLPSTVVKKAGLIKNWTPAANSFPSRTLSRATSVATGRSKSQVPTLTDTSTRLCVKSVLTDTVVISQDRQKNQGSATPDDIGERGLEDEDETQGQERNAAVASPIKGRKRITSAVSPTVWIFLEIAHFTLLRISSRSKSVRIRLESRLDKAVRSGPALTFLPHATSITGGASPSFRRTSGLLPTKKIHGSSTIP